MGGLYDSDEEIAPEVTGGLADDVSASIVPRYMYSCIPLVVLYSTCT